MPAKSSSLTIARANELRKIIREAHWKASTSERYKTTPHQYIIATESGPEWKLFADNIATYGEIPSWRGQSKMPKSPVPPPPLTSPNYRFSPAATVFRSR
jgi:hypothetical protein